jgi:hypothetical protein
VTFAVAVPTPSPPEPLGPGVGLARQNLLTRGHAVERHPPMLANPEAFTHWVVVENDSDEPVEFRIHLPPAEVDAAGPGGETWASVLLVTGDDGSVLAAALTNGDENAAPRIAVDPSRGETLHVVPADEIEPGSLVHLARFTVSLDGDTARLVRHSA